MKFSVSPSLYLSDYISYPSFSLILLYGWQGPTISLFIVEQDKRDQFISFWNVVEI